MYTLIMQGGPMMWLILLCSLVATVLFLERWLHLHRAQIRPVPFIKGIINNIQRDNIAEAVTLCEDTPGPVARIVQAAVLHGDDGETDIRRAIEATGKSELPRLESRLGLIATLARVTPLFGLVGTVLAMMNTLLLMEQRSPLVQSADLTGGLWQALISTGAGLCVAALITIAHNLLVGRVESIMVDMDRASGDMLTFLVKRQREGAGKGRHD